MTRRVASYTDDGDAFYERRACGNRFSFDGGIASYDESGTFVLNANGNATKNSTWRDTGGGSCSGRCSDQLNRL